MGESGEVSGYFWLGCLVEAAVTSRPECCRICFQTDSTLPHMAVPRPRVLTNWGPPQGCTHGSQLPPDPREEKRRAGSLSAICNLIPEGHDITSVVFYWLLRPILDHEKYTKLWIPGSRHQWDPSWRLATTKHTLGLSYFSWNSSLVFQDNIPSWFFCF